MMSSPDHSLFETDHPAQVLASLQKLIWAGLFFALAIFAAVPGLDLLVSARYYRAGQGFVHARDPFVLALYDWTPWLGRGLVLVLLLYAVLAPVHANWLARRQQAAYAEQARGPWRHGAVLAVCCALLGPGLVIEGVFKNVVGRPRPVQIQPFGGPDAYVRPFAHGADPSSHKSFASSHAAAGFALISLGLTCGPVWRRRWLLIGLVAGSVVGFGRILQGGHFLSDIVFAFYAVWLSCELVAWVDRRRTAARTSPPPSTRRARHRA
jgi:lipid A 4'-phosphatase